MKAIEMLVKGWKNVGSFMIECNQIQASNDAWWNSYSYGERVKFYPYLPEVEEARDWLDKCYGRQVS